MSDKTADTTEYLTVTEAAVRLSSTSRQVRRWIEAGFFPGAIRLSPQRKSEYRIPLAAVVQFEKNRQVKVG